VIAGDYSYKHDDYKKALRYYQTALTKVIATKKEEDHVKKQIEKCNNKLAPLIMILGIGIDMIEVERMSEKMGRAEGFAELVFSKNEIDYCEKKKNKFEHYAARFAAKEAFYKAIGSGWKNGTSFNEIEISNDEKGKPSIIY